MIPQPKIPKIERMKLPKSGETPAYAIIIDVNHYTLMVSAAQSLNELIAQFTRDTLSYAILEIEREGGEVVGFMGDAILGILPTGDSVVQTCFAIAKDLDEQCEYTSVNQTKENQAWAFCPGGPSLKIAVEYGPLDISTIGSRLLGEHRLFAGNAINHAARISAAGTGNRCIVGPAAAKLAFSSYPLEGPHFTRGKRGEPKYEYHFFSMGDIWIEGTRRKGQRTYWG